MLISFRSSAYPSSYPFCNFLFHFPLSKKRHSRPEHVGDGGNPYIYSSLDWRQPAAAAATAAGAAAAIAVIHLALCAADRGAAAACGWLAGQGADRAEEDEEAGEGEGSSFIRKKKRAEKKISIVAAKA